jgi:hypothetical protein
MTSLRPAIDAVTGVAEANEVECAERSLAAERPNGKSKKIGSES